MKKRPQGLADQRRGRPQSSGSWGEPIRMSGGATTVSNGCWTMWGGKQKGGKGVERRSQGQIDRGEPGKKGDELRSPKSRRNLTVA